MANSELSPNWITFSEAHYGFGDYELCNLMLGPTNTNKYQVYETFTNTLMGEFEADSLEEAQLKVEEMARLENA